jgi:uncharacterized protein (TIGR02145 family)
MRFLSFIVFLLLALHTCAQRVTNVTAEQQGQELLIHYHLEAEGPVEVLLYLSTDRGSRWEGPLKSCSGDVGPNVAPGTDKRIRWEVLKDRELVGDGIAFKVVAKGGVKKEWLNPSLSYGSVTDIDGNTYATIQIGKQVWMAENLRTTRYSDGSALPELADDKAWSGARTGGWCTATDGPHVVPGAGSLYNVRALSDARNVCPAGWHLPTETDWNILMTHLGGSKQAAAALRGRQGWSGGMSTAGNESGFSAIPVHSRRFDGFRGGIQEACWFSNDPKSGGTGYWRLDTSDPEVRSIKNWTVSNHGFSVRCLRD